MRVLVPLDGTRFAASILPDARRLAGPRGDLILVQDASVLGTRWSKDVATIYERNKALGSATEYLESVTRDLRANGANVELRALNLGDPAYAIDAAASAFRADMVACATHGRGMFGRLLWGSVARRALLDSPVPVLLRRAPEEVGADSPTTSPRRILLPLDGSRQAERAVPLAFNLARQWEAEVRLVQVIPDQWSTPMDQLSTPTDTSAHLEQGPGTEELNYLHLIATDALQPATSDVARPSMAASEGPCASGSTSDASRPSMAATPPRYALTAESTVLAGPVADRLASAVDEWSITDVVMTTHGRTGLPRVILGSVSDALVHRLSCPIIIVPALHRP